MHDIITTAQESISEIKEEDNENSYLYRDSLLNDTNKNASEKASNEINCHCLTKRK